MGNKQLKFGAVLSYFSIALNILAGLIYTPWMVAQIGQADYGLYTLANSLIGLFLMDFGLSLATSRYVAKYRAEGRQDKVDEFLGVIYKLYLLISAVILIALVIVYFLIDTIYVKLTPDELQKFKVVYIMAAAFAVVNFPFVTFNGILNAYEKFVPLKLADVIYRVLLIAGTVVTLLLGGGLYGLVAIHAAVGLLLILYKFLVIKKTVPVKPNFRHRDWSLYKDIFGFSIWITIASLAQRLVFNITPSILGVVASSAAIAVFGIIATIEGYTYTITNAINGMFIPKISRIYTAENASENMMPLMLKVGRFQYALSGLIAVGFAVVGKQFITLWMDASYIDAYAGILLVIIPGMFYNSLEIANTAMTVQKKVDLQAYINVAMGVVNVALSFVLSRYWGVLGACLSIFVAYMLRAVALMVVYHKVMKFNMVVFIKRCYVRMSIPMLITVAFGLAMNHWIADGGWIHLLMKAAMVCVVYLITMVLLGLDREEKAQIIRWLQRRKRS